jgi:hypothetical protein
MLKSQKCVLNSALSNILILLINFAFSSSQYATDGSNLEPRFAFVVIDEVSTAESKSAYVVFCKTVPARELRIRAVQFSIEEEAAEMKLKQKVLERSPFEKPMFP